MEHIEPQGRVDALHEGDGAYLGVRDGGETQDLLGAALHVSSERSMKRADEQSAGLPIETKPGAEWPAVGGEAGLDSGASTDSGSGDT